MVGKDRWAEQWQFTYNAAAQKFRGLAASLTMPVRDDPGASGDFSRVLKNDGTKCRRFDPT
ncbi:hypothetical protein [Xanthomonas arboricola]|nr:hypothetical protein [Xanthomonas arboricola]